MSYIYGIFNYLVFKNREKCSCLVKEKKWLYWCIYYIRSFQEEILFFTWSAQQDLNFLSEIAHFFAVGKSFFSSHLLYLCLLSCDFFQGTIQLGEYTFYFRKIISLYVVTQQYMYILKSFSNKVEIGKISLVT